MPSHRHSAASRSWIQSFLSGLLLASLNHRRTVLIPFFCAQAFQSDDVGKRFVSFDCLGHKDLNSTFRFVEFREKIVLETTERRFFTVRQENLYLAHGRRRVRRSEHLLNSSGDQLRASGSLTPVAGRSGLFGWWLLATRFRRGKHVDLELHLGP